jgi:C4-dicarboxylate-specific signal transduction histidine kinase
MIGVNPPSAVKPTNNSRLVVTDFLPTVFLMPVRHADCRPDTFALQAVGTLEVNIIKRYGTGIEIEDRKRAEEQLRQAQADLAHVNRMTTIEELPTSLAHEVKQPIAAASTNADTWRWLAGDTPNIGEARRP